MRFITSLKLRSKLLLGFLVAGLFPILILGTLIYTKGSTVIIDQLNSQLTSIREIKKDQLRRPCVA